VDSASLASANLGAYVTNAGVQFENDTGFSGGTAETTAFAVGGTDDDPLYYTYRTGTKFSYNFGVPNGKYKLELFFTEPTATAAGQREFNVAAQGKTVLKNIDVFAAAGAKTALIDTVDVSVTDKTLSLKFTGVVGDAILSALELVPG
jgi:hypothetical protein